MQNEIIDGQKSEIIITNNNDAWRKLAWFVLIFLPLFYFWLLISRSTLDEQLSFIFLIPFFLLFLKWLETYLVLKVTLDYDHQKATFSRTWGKTELSKENLEWWGIRAFYNYQSTFGEPAYKTKNYHFEAQFKNGQKFIYPLPSPKYKTSQQAYLELFEKTLKSKPKNLEEFTQSFWIPDTLGRDMIYLFL